MEHGKKPTGRAAPQPQDNGGGGHSFTPVSGHGELPEDIRQLLAPQRRRRYHVLAMSLRVMFITGVMTTLVGAWLGYQWLQELRVFDVDKSRIDYLASRRQGDNSLVFDRDGKKIGEFFNTYSIYHPYKKIPRIMIQAIVAIEDRNFFHHKGFDPKGILRAAVARLKGSDSKQGASTLTQQVVRNFLLPRERSIQRKIQEIGLAVQVEKRLSKDRIMEIYANSLFLGNGSYGVGAAAYRYFGKSLQELELHEAALIAGLFQSPSRYNPVRFPKRARKRQIQVMKAMVQAGFIPFDTAKKAIGRKLEYKEYRPANTATAPYFIDYIKEEATRLLKEKGIGVDNQGLRIYTTTDIRMQKEAEQAVADSADLLNKAQERTGAVQDKSGKTVRATLETAILSTDPKNGEILAMVGGRDYNKTKFNRTWQALRSPGSSFKPIVYSLALQEGWKWSDVIFVSPITINNYRPHTPTDDYLTETTMLRAFYRSMNTPTIEIGQKLTLRKVLEQARRLGIRSPVKEEFGSLLGSSEVTMMDLARLYQVFANGGKLVEPIAIRKITDRSGKVLYKAAEVEERTTQAVTPQIAYLMTQAMRAVLAMGTGYTSAKLSGVAAGKTGTSNDSTDNWFCGYTPNHVSIVWVGTDEHATIHGDVTGGKLALPIWDRYMTRSFELRKPEPFRAPPGIVTAVIHPKFGNRSPVGVRMFFQRGHEPPGESSALETLLSTPGSSYRDVFAH